MAGEGEEDSGLGRGGGGLDWRLVKLAIGRTQKIGEGRWRLVELRRVAVEDRDLELWKGRSESVRLRSESLSECLSNLGLALRI